MKEVKKVVINDEEYVKASEVREQAKELDGKEYVLIRGDRSGVFVGYLGDRAGKEVTLYNARRLWYWNGAASLSQLAMEGVSKPQDCKFPCEVDRMLITDAIEIISVTEKARLSIAGVEIWQK